MADNLIVTFVPIVGEENLVTAIDNDDQVRKPIVTSTIGGAGLFVPKNSNGDGGPPTDPSEIVTDPDGRAGSLRTILHMVLGDDEGATPINGENVQIAINIPYNMKGLAGTGRTLAQLNDPDNFPNIDPSRFLPKVSLIPQFTPWANAEGTGPTQGFVDGILNLLGTSVVWPAGIEVTAGAIGYVAPQGAAAAAAALLVSDANVEAYGSLILSFEFVAPAVFDGTTSAGTPPLTLNSTPAVLPVGAAWLIDIDFSASVAS